MAASPEKPKFNAPPTSVNGRGSAGVKDYHHDIFFAAVETTRMPMIVTDPHQPDNPIIFANNAFVNMTGYSRSELIGYNCRFLQGPQTDQETINELRQAIAEQREFSSEMINYRKDGTTFWNALFVSPVYNKEGDLIYYFASQLDVSRRRDAEEGLHQAQKMEALGQLTGGIAHDFNNLLQVISGFTDIVQTLADKGQNDEIVDFTRLGRAGDALRTATDRASKLTQQLLAFSRKQRLDGRAINLNTLIGTISEIADRTLGDQVVIEPMLASNLWNCRVDPTQAEVALLNVLLNARDAIPEGGKLVIKTQNEVISEEDVLRRGLKPGCYVSVAVTDNGVGMPPEIRSRVLEPFFTTKPDGKGTGLGLAMVYGFVKQSDGAIEIESEVGKGTTVRLLFPSTDQIPIKQRKPVVRAVDRMGTETILIVDDRDDVAETASMILQDFGYTVILAREPVEALDILSSGTKVHLLFTDLIMPGGINGVMLARAARERQHKIKILLTTGFAEASMERTDAGGIEFDIIMKPYRSLDLARKVRRVLDGPTGTR